MRDRLSALVLALGVSVVVQGLLPHHHAALIRQRSASRQPCTELNGAAADGNDAKKKKKKGYQFGDITRSVFKAATGKDDYKFGDLSRHLDKQVKNKISELSGKEYYEFGDLTRWVDAAAKERVANYTGKANTTYQFGDITLETVRRARTGEYDVQDVFLALRILFSAGAAVSPVASILPVKWLFELINLGLAQDVAWRFIEVLANALDARMKEALTGDSKYQLGDVSKRKLAGAIADFTGKETYQPGDITRRLVAMSQDAKSQQKALPSISSVEKELEDWDDKFQRSQAKHTEGSDKVSSTT